MKKLRKIIALLVGMMMTVSLMPQTVLGTEFDGTPVRWCDHIMPLCRRIPESHFIPRDPLLFHRGR